jgi:hypothetical protein
MGIRALAWIAKYQHAYPELIDGFAQSEEAGYNISVFRLTRRYYVAAAKLAGSPSQSVYKGGIKEA